MSPKYWEGLPEAALIPELIQQSPGRLQVMAENHRQAAQVDVTLSLEKLKGESLSCKACPLHSRATQTVFGVDLELQKS